MKKIILTFFFLTMVFMVSEVVAELNEGLLHHWAADGNANDIIGSSNGTLEGSVIYAQGKIGQAFMFNGNSNDGINMGDVSDLNFSPNDEFSIVAWININQLCSAPNDGSFIIAINYNCSNTAQVISLSSSKVAFWVRDKNRIQSMISSDISLNKWHHIVAIRKITENRKTLMLFLNGTIVGSIDDKSYGQLSNNCPDYIGRRNTCGTNNPFNGLIDEISIYNRALSDSEIQQLYQKENCTFSDTDSDGVIDIWDKCPNTPLNSYVNSTGCPLSDNSALSGQVLMKGQPLTQGNATLFQSGELFQKSPIDSNGWYKFENVSGEKSINIMIRKPVE